jgi:uncharacterized membrane protein YhaH (DUF805 family)
MVTSKLLKLLSFEGTINRLQWWMAGIITASLILIDVTLTQHLRSTELLQGFHILLTSLIFWVWFAAGYKRLRSINLNPVHITWSLFSILTIGSIGLCIGENAFFTCIIPGAAYYVAILVMMAFKPSAQIPE